VCFCLHWRWPRNGRLDSGLITLRFPFFNLIVGLCCLFAGNLYPTVESDLQFRADHYERDLRSKTEKGVGKAWVRYQDKEIWADEIELDRFTGKAIANGNVKLREKNLEIFCNRAIYALDGSEALLEEATLLIGQMVVTGATVKKTGPNRYELTEGIYTNCNTIPISDRTAGKCLFDWKLYGRKFDLTVDGYIYAYDVIIYSKDLPLSYLPFFIAPAKSRRQTGLLMPSVTTSNHVGTGFSIPFFWAMSPWQDLTFTPTYFTVAGFHLGSEYNYAYSDKSRGGFSLFFNAQPFNARRANPELLNAPDNNDPTNPVFIPKNKILNFAGELALTLKNTIHFGEGILARQSVNYVSDPFYVQDYPNDIGLGKSNLGYLRSLATLTYPTEKTLYYLGIIHHQSLIVSTDSPPTTQPEKKADRGSLTQLPRLGLSQKFSEITDRYLYFEFDSQLNHFWRPAESFDNNKPLPGDNDITPGAPFQTGDFIREGQRVQFEPKLIAQFPLTKGLEIQPLFRGLFSAYHFDLPNSTTPHRESLSTEIPLSFYLSRRFDSPFLGLNKVSHLIQPRLIYANLLYKSPIPSHPFFETTHPSFDRNDLVSNFEYLKLELIQRFRRQVDKESVRFITFQLSNQYNSRIDRSDIRFFDPTLNHHLGPLVGYLNIEVSSLSATLEGYYQWEKDSVPGQNPKNEYSWTSTLNYNFGQGDSVSLSTLIRNAVDATQDEQLVSLGVNKSLPVFLNLSANTSYSTKRGELRSYEWGAHFASKPTSCWSLSVLSGRTLARQTYARFLFTLNLGGSVGSL